MPPWFFLSSPESGVNGCSVEACRLKRLTAPILPLLPTDVFLAAVSFPRAFGSAGAPQFSEGGPDDLKGSFF